MVRHRTKDAVLRRQLQVVQVLHGTNPASGDFSFELKVTGKQTLCMAGKSRDCYVVDVGLGGVYGAFVAHSTHWYDCSAPHVLVKSVAPVGGPGSPMRTFELQSYDTK
jgi:hypothetical protein